MLAIAPNAIAVAAIAISAVMVSTTLLRIRTEALQWMAANDIGARLSKAVVAAGPSCANVSSMFVRAPENDMNFGADVTLTVQEMEDRFSEAYTRAFDVPLLDHSSYYRGELMENFHPYSYRQLASEYPCIVVRTPQAVRRENLAGTPRAQSRSLPGRWHLRLHGRHRLRESRAGV